MKSHIATDKAELLHSKRNNQKQQRGCFVVPKAKEKILEVTEAELCEYLNLSGRRIRTLATESVVVKTKAGRYDLKKSVSGYVDFIKDTKKEEKQGIDKVKLAREAEGLMHDKLKKRKTELQVMQLEKTMLLTEDVIDMWSDFATMVKSKLLNIPTKLAPQLTGIDDVNIIKKAISTEVSEALNEIADFDINKFESEIAFDDESGEDNSNNNIDR